MIYDAPVSTGRDGYETPTGQFAIYLKLEKQTMRGWRNGETWQVPDVPYVMYIYGDVALHGTYWHTQFGTGARLSHGCINLPLDDAALQYDLAPLDTPVQCVINHPRPPRSDRGGYAAPAIVLLRYRCVAMVATVGWTTRVQSA